MRILKQWAVGIVLSLSMTAAGCASFQRPAAQTEDNLRLTHQGGSPNSLLSTLRSEARWYAFLYCQNRSKNVRVISFEDAEGPFFTGNFPKTDIIFSCTGE